MPTKSKERVEEMEINSTSPQRCTTLQKLFASQDFIKFLDIYNRCRKKGIKSLDLPAGTKAITADELKNNPREAETAVKFYNQLPLHNTTPATVDHMKSIIADAMAVICDRHTVSKQIEEIEKREFPSNSKK